MLVDFALLTGFLEIGRGVGAVSSSSLEGTSNTLAQTGEADEGLLEVYRFDVPSDLSDSSGVMLGDLDPRNWLTFVSSSSD